MPDSVDSPAPDSTITSPAVTRSATAPSATSALASWVTTVPGSCTRPVCPPRTPAADPRAPPVRLLGLGLGRPAHDATHDLAGRQAVVHGGGDVLDDRHVDVVRARQLEDRLRRLHALGDLGGRCDDL